VVNQSNFARHFGVAVSTFNRWLGTWGGSEFAHLSPGGTAAAKGRQKAKASKKAQADAAQQTRRMVADDATGFMDQLDVHKLDQSMWWLNCKILADSDLPQRQKAKVAQEWLEFLDEEAKAIEAARDELLRALTEAEEHAA
jgi:hypothetical protein